MVQLPRIETLSKTYSQMWRAGRQRLKGEALASLTRGRQWSVTSASWPGPRCGPQDCPPLQVSGTGRASIRGQRWRAHCVIPEVADLEKQSTPT